MQNSPVFYWGKNFIDKINLDNANKILEVGCRKGNLSAYLAMKDQQRQLIAIDNLDGEITQAKMNYQLPNLTFEKADALALDYPEYFDAVVSFSCLHWIQDKIKALQNIYQSLKPGGKAFLQFFVMHGRLKNDRFFYQIAKTSRWKNYFRNFIPDYFEITFPELSQLLLRTGFVIHRVEFSRHETIFEHPDILHQWFGTWSSHIKRVPEKKRDFFTQEILQEYLTFHHYTRHDRFPYYEYLLEIVCERPSTPDKSTQSDARQYGAIVFTKKEVAVLKYYLQGKSAKEISQLTTVTAKTVEFHLAKIKEKLNCHRRSEIVQAALTHGFIDLLF